VYFPVLFVSIIEVIGLWNDPYCAGCVWVTVMICGMVVETLVLILMAFQLLLHIHWLSVHPRFVLFYLLCVMMC